MSMYRHCIYCSADLGANEALEGFPVGRTVAFDAARGRLWAVCRRCARWNLAPIEERWEAVEHAERRFAASRLRVQAESIGVAKTADGTRLVRIGAAQAGELAAWRYGSELRRRHLWFWPAVAAGAGAALLQVLPFGMAAAFAPAIYFGVAQYLGATRRVIRVPADESPTGRVLDLRGVNVSGAVVRPGGAPGEIRLEVPTDGLMHRLRGSGPDPLRPVVTLTGDAARRTVERAMPLVNAFGGSRAQVSQAVAELSRRESAAAVLDDMARNGARLGVAMVTGSHRTGGAPLTGPRALAFEMALHDETERRALQGELKLLESAWREAEALAEIADGLVGVGLKSGVLSA